MEQKIAIIIGAGPAGLTAAYELLFRTDIKPIIFEMSNDFGGLSRTVNYKGNRIDIGGHRFFSKSERVIQWWQNILPLEGTNLQNGSINGDLDSKKVDKVMLIRNRLSRILFLRKFFNYPISLNKSTIKNLGIFKTLKVGASYLKCRLSPIRKEKSLEDFFINRFGKELYATFLKDYTEKIWGVPCNKIKPEWGAQRIKGLSVFKTLVHALKKRYLKDQSITQKKTETSLIEHFMYPKFGPGQMWNEVAKIVKEKGGEIYKDHKVIGIKYKDNKITEVKVKDEINNTIKNQQGDYFFSTMPVKELINCFEEDVPIEVREVANGLIYRDFITVGLLLKKLKVTNETSIKTFNNIIPDNWIYVQEKDVKIGRLQIFNNWSPYMVQDPNTIWIGLEYFCNIGDELWSKSNADFISFAIDELIKIDIINKEDVLDNTIIRMPNTYPAYFGTYDQFNVIRSFVDRLENLFLIGRNGMHRYNNQDHSMLTAMAAVENIINSIKIKDNIWAVNVEQEYHEERKVRK